MKDSCELIDTICNLCGDSKARQVFAERFDVSGIDAYAFSARRAREIQHFRIVRCETCGMIRSDPILSMEFTDDLYKQSQFLYEQESPFAAHTYFNLFKRIPAMLGQDSQVLDIGCSNGAFLQELFNHGYRRINGCEPSEKVAAVAPEKIKNSIVVSKFDRELFKENSFHVITAFHLIDHLHDPLQFLVDCKSLLKSNGHLMVVCHNEQAISAMLLGEYSPIYDIEHTHLFDRKTLKQLLKKAGFTVLSIGSMVNTYPVGYWLRLIPYTNKYLLKVPKQLRKLPLPLPAGNIYAISRVSR